LFLEGGRVVDRGTHADLTARSAAYRDIVDAYDQARYARERDAVPVGAGDPS
jgi:hypothetical protein